jgi:hypothetical protein
MLWLFEAGASCLLPKRVADCDGTPAAELNVLCARLKRWKGSPDTMADPVSGKSPFQSDSGCTGNAPIVDLLFYLRIQEELLNIRIRDIDWGSHQIVIARWSNESSDSRKRQPLVEALDRRIPLRELLVDRIYRRRHWRHTNRGSFALSVYLG